MRLFVLISDDGEYHHRLYRRLFEARDREVLGIANLPHLPGGWRHRLRQVWRLLVLYGSVCFVRRLMRRWRTPRVWVRDLAREHGIPVHEFGQVNDPELLRIITAADVDVIVSSCNQIIGPQLLKSSRLGVINKHAGLLPRYRGVWPVFWAMRNGEREIGVSIHFMTEKIDAGRILVQRSFAAPPGSTLEGMYDRVFEMVPDMMLEALDKIDCPEFPGNLRENDVGHGSYFSYPSFADVREFRRRGFRVM